MDTFTLPQNSLRPLLLQRMEYMSARSHTWRRRLGRELHSCFVIDMIDKNRTSTIAQLFFEDMQREFDSIKNHLPETVSHILISAGVCVVCSGIDTLLNEHYTNHPKFTLLDHNNFAKKITYGFSSSPCAYHSFEQTCQFLSNNDLSQKNSAVSTSTPNHFQAISNLIWWSL